MKKYQVCPKCGRTINKIFNKTDNHSSWTISSINRHPNYSSFIIEACPHCNALLYNKYRRPITLALRILYFIIIVGISLSAFLLWQEYLIIYIATAITICAIVDLTLAQLLFTKINQAIHVQKYILLDNNFKKWNTPTIFTAKIEIVTSKRDITNYNILKVEGYNLHVVIKSVKQNVGEFTFIVDEKEAIAEMLSRNRSFNLSDGEKIVANIIVMECYT